MERIKFDQLGSLGKMNYLKTPAEFGFLESGYFHVDDCEGDHHFYYRYLVNGDTWEMLADDVYMLSKMTFDEREKFLTEHYGPSPADKFRIYGNE